MWRRNNGIVVAGVRGTHAMCLLHALSDSLLKERAVITEKENAGARDERPLCRSPGAERPHVSRKVPRSPAGVCHRGSPS